MIFLVSCARSGSTILGETLAQHPDIHYYGEELQHYWHTLGGLKDHHEIGPDEATIKMSREAQITVIGPCDKMGQIPFDKCPPNIFRIGFLSKLFPSARFIHLVRDGRDVALSLLPGLTGEWNHLKPEDWKFLSTLPPLLRGAYLWRRCVIVGLYDLGNYVSSIHYRLIRYEDLIDSPVETVSRLLDFLGLRVQDESAPIYEFARNNISNNTSHPYHARNQVRWFRDDHKTRVGRYKEQLGADDLDLLNSILGADLERLGYTV